LGLRLRSS